MVTGSIVQELYSIYIVFKENELALLILDPANCALIFSQFLGSEEGRGEQEQRREDYWQVGLLGCTGRLKVFNTGCQSDWAMSLS